MDDKARCQSCGQPINVNNFGTNASGSMNFEYCNNCFIKGGFTDPDMTCARMVQMSIDNMVKDLAMDPEEAKTLAYEYIPRLKRWRQRF